MDRPHSATRSATSTPTTQTAAGHKRTTSSIKSSGSKLAHTTTTTLFVTNLRLLDLDLLPDWPGITAATFAPSADARTRIKSVEHALYHLFRLLDPATTADKLQPFYPPLEPLQSVNLRAALYRCLNELKKGGMLGKETILRKTMLDECQGDKFWELCLVFSAAVLKRTRLDKSKRRHTRWESVAETLGAAASLNGTQKDLLVPLTIAHRASLGKSARERQQRRDTYVRLYDALIQKEAELAQRKTRARRAATSRPSSQEVERLDSVDRKLETSWIGNHDLRVAIVSGDEAGKGDDFLTQPFEQLWDGDDPGQWREGLSSTSTAGLLGALDRATAVQRRRLRRWQSLHDKMLAMKSSNAAQGQLDAPPSRPHLRFDRHRGVNSQDLDISSGHNDHLPESEPPGIGSRYDEILAAMREELRQSRKADTASPVKRKVPAGRPHPLRIPSVHLDAPPQLDMPQRSPNRSPSQTAVPMRPGMGRRMTSRSRSYQQPKVDSQRQPIPLKTELFSPLKSERRGSGSPLASSLASSMGDAYTGASKPATQVGDDHEMSGNLGMQAETADKHATGLGIDFASSDANKHDSANASVSEASTHEPTTNATASSLMERTRLSIMFASADDHSNPTPDTAREVDVATEDYDRSPAFSENDSKTTLLERTRQSMAPLRQAPATAPSGKKRPAGHARARTSVHISDEADRPRTRRSSLGVEPVKSHKRDITPREQLFSPEAGYDSIFRARPKVALSPVLGASEVSENVGLEVELVDMDSDDA